MAGEGRRFAAMLGPSEYNSPPAMQRVIERHASGEMESSVFQYCTMSIPILNILLTHPSTVNAVADILRLTSNPKKLIPTPKRHDTATEACSYFVIWPRD